ncbi:MAG: substrate-binding domain-containing protein [Gammaproteobacteria bacterium]|nr:substrate-binding domain-containing protein [Gammaproteobacteria bacterium]MCP5417889.1 substrate-binding domain-containing protein [Chromatiaceae bacterium]
MKLSNHLHVCRDPEKNTELEFTAMKHDFFRIVFLSGLFLFSNLVQSDDIKLRLVTTNTDNSGLLAVLLSAFEHQSHISVRITVAKTGRALRMGQAGDVDVVLAHAPGAEKAFVDAGWGIQRRDVMYNDFVLVGPESDPASNARRGNAGVALRGIAQTQSVFISSGDDSGIHQKSSLMAIRWHPVHQ